MNELETRQLRYFVAVAEELHFGRAADRLGIAQPPLSKAIRDLERQLGVHLLARTTRRVTLTQAGQTLLADARNVLDAAAAAARRARRAGHQERKLRVALKADFDAGLLPLILDAYDALPVDECTISLRARSSPPLLPCSPSATECASGRQHTRGRSGTPPAAAPRQIRQPDPTGPREALEPSEHDAQI